MLKVRTDDKKISPFGGINFVIHEIEQAGIPQLIDASLPKRHGGAKYKFSDALLGTVYGIYCGMERLEDLETLKHLMHNSSLNIPSSDNVSMILRRNLTTANETVKAEGSDIQHRINTNPAMNALLLDTALKLGVLKPNKGYVLDYDNHVIPCEKEDSLFAYTKERGYQPGVCFIGPNPVYVEGMNGNHNAQFDQVNTLKRVLANLTERGIKVRRFRADNASYQKEVIELFDVEGCDFFLRATNSHDLYEHVMDVMDWEKVRLGDDFFEIGSFKYKPFGMEKEYRVVTGRRPADKPHHVTGKNFVYRSILTNNKAMSDLDVIWTYNQRGKIEKNFDALNNDWNWNKLPFSFLAENTTYLLLTALGMVTYNYLVKLFSSRVDFVEATFRMKALRFNLINVAAEWKGETLLIHDKSRPWEKLAG